MGTGDENSDSDGVSLPIFIILSWMYPGFDKRLTEVTFTIRDLLI